MKKMLVIFLAAMLIIPAMAWGKAKTGHGSETENVESPLQTAGTYFNHYQQPVKLVISLIHNWSYTVVKGTMKQHSNYHGKFEVYDADGKPIDERPHHSVFNFSDPEDIAALHY
ncbi:hypothetical protein ACFL60_08475, partial [Candidatus Omnitrophota bacterium]